MLLRALVAFLALPGMVAFVLPVWIGTSGGRVAFPRHGGWLASGKAARAVSFD